VVFEFFFSNFWGSDYFGYFFLILHIIVYLIVGLLSLIQFTFFLLFFFFVFHLPCRYFTSPPAPTNPASLPRPPRKGESIPKAPEINPTDGPTVLSPPRKLRRVMPNRTDGNEENVHNADKFDDHVGEGRTAGATSSRNDSVPMSIDFSVFGSRPPPRPTINR